MNELTTEQKKFLEELEGFLSKHDSSFSSLEILGEKEKYILAKLLSFNSIAQFLYSYDKASNRTSLQTSRQGLNVTQTLDFKYDSTNQLVSAPRPLLSQPDETFIYDSLGNRIRRDGDTQDAVIGAGNRLLEDSNFIYTHDDNGNLIEKINKSSGKITRYRFDFENRMISLTEHINATAPPGKLVQYKYDALGRRIEKSVDGNITRYVFDNEDILLEFDGSNTLQARYTHGFGIDEPLFMERSGEVFTYHTDGLGSIVALTNSNGQTLQSYVYNSFGGTKIFDEAAVQIAADQGIKNPYTFTGRELDPESGLYYYRARFYNADIGRFIQEDPIGLAGQDVNLYRYVRNNPLRFVDPNGRQIPLGLEILLNLFILVNTIDLAEDFIDRIRTQHLEEKEEEALKEFLRRRGDEFLNPPEIFGLPLDAIEAFFREQEEGQCLFSR